jgi:hypothetical protein
MDHPFFMSGWTGPSQIVDAARFETAMARFDSENARDPILETVDQVAYPRELIYARRLSDWVQKLCSDASEELRLAARCQHLCRWMIPRDSYEKTRSGYLKWRNDLKKFHAEKAGEILRETGYPEEMIAKVQQFNLKSHFPQDPESRVLEDALCLVFLQYQLADLAAKTTEDKVINALRKSWGKMTAAARQETLKMTFDAETRQLLDQALKDLI